MATTASAGASHQYFRTGEWPLFFLFRLTGAGMVFSLATKGEQTGVDSLVCYNPNSSPRGGGEDAVSRISSP